MANDLPALHVAIRKGYFDQIRKLVEKGDCVNARDKIGRTPLMICGFIQDEWWAVGIARMLLERGARPKSVDTFGMNALCYAVAYQREDLVRVLLKEAGLDYDLNHGDKNGNTACFYAAQSGNVAITRMLLETLKKYHLSVDKANKQGMTPLLEASRLGHRNCCEILIYEGQANAYKRDKFLKRNAQEWEDVSKAMEGRDSKRRSGHGNFGRRRPRSFYLTSSSISSSSPTSSTTTSVFRSESSWSNVEMKKPSTATATKRATTAANQRPWTVASPLSASLQEIRSIESSWMKEKRDIINATFKNRPRSPQRKGRGGGNVPFKHQVSPKKTEKGEQPKSELSNETAAPVVVTTDAWRRDFSILFKNYEIYATPSYRPTAVYVPPPVNTPLPTVEESDSPRSISRTSRRPSLMSLNRRSSSANSIDSNGSKEVASIFMNTLRRKTSRSENPANSSEAASKVLNALRRRKTSVHINESGNSSGKEEENNNVNAAGNGKSSGAGFLLGLLKNRGGNSKLSPKSIAKSTIKETAEEESSSSANREQRQNIQNKPQISITVTE